MYMHDQIGLLDDDGRPLEPIDEPSTDPEPWKVFAPRSFGGGALRSGLSGWRRWGSCLLLSA